MGESRMIKSSQNNCLTLKCFRFVYTLNSHASKHYYKLNKTLTSVVIELHAHKDQDDFLRDVMGPR